MSEAIAHKPIYKDTDCLVDEQLNDIVTSIKEIHDLNIQAASLI